MTATILADPERTDPVPVERRARPPRRAPRPRPPATPRPETADGAAVAATAMLVVAAVCGWFVLQLLVLGGFEQARSQQDLYAQLRQDLAAQTAPLGGAIDPGVAVAIIAIPTIGLQQVVVEGTSSGDLLAGPGHLRSSVLPGQQGVAVVLGRAATYGAPFRSVPTLQAGDGITVTTGQGEFTYRVEGVRRGGDPLPARLAKGGARLTLVTVDGHGITGAVAPGEVVFVDATLQGDAAVGEPGRPSGVPDAEDPLGVDPSILPVLVLLLQALLVAVAGTLLLRRRVPGRVAWIIAAPVLIALAWATTEAAVRLLPNLV